MTMEELRILGSDCYAAFGRTCPEFKHKCWLMWAEVCAGVPVGAGTWIRSQVIKRDSLPFNFGKLVHDLYLEWRQTYGASRQASSCGICDAQTPGYFTIWRKNGERLLARCACNAEAAASGQGPGTPEDLDRMGYIVRRPGDRRSIARFEADTFGIRRGKVTVFGEMAKSLARVPAKPEPVREEHAEQMALYDGAVPF